MINLNMCTTILFSFPIMKHDAIYVRMFSKNRRKPIEYFISVAHSSKSSEKINRSVLE